jgi:peptidoglycan-N-acetylmuramic acid deacetylase
MKKIAIGIILLLIIGFAIGCNNSVKIDEDKEPSGPVVEEPKEEEEKKEEKENPQEDQNKEDQESEDKQEQEKNNDKNNGEVKEEEKEEEKEDKQEEKQTPYKKIEKKGYVTANSLNVRNTYSIKGKIITQISKGKEVHVYGETYNWYKVRYTKDKEGWVSSKYIQFKPISKPKPEPKPDPKPEPKPEPSEMVDKIIEKKGYVTTNGLNVRTTYSMKGKIITQVNKGTQVHVYGETSGWYKVSYAKNKEGWVYSSYIQFNPIKNPPTNPSDNLSNKAYNWYFSRKSNHSQPTFGSPHKSLIDKHNGIAIGSKNSKDIYLTFDNGYENGYTNKILDILKANGVKVGFFVQGTYIDKNPSIVKRMVNEGHLVLNHTNSHPKMPSLSKEKLQQEIKTTESKYKKLTGKNMAKFLRPPSGTFSERTLSLTKDMGYTTVFWSMAHRDWVVNDQPGKQATYDHVTANIHNGAIILLHSVSKSNTEALDDIIKELKSRGYKFKALTQFH